MGATAYLFLPHGLALRVVGAELRVRGTARPGLRLGLSPLVVGLTAVLGTISVLLTGGIGLLDLDNRWLAVKEAAIPDLLGLVVAGSAFTRRPLACLLLYNRTIFDAERIDAALAARGNTAAFEVRLRAATWVLGGAFFFASAMNDALAKRIVTSAAGTAAFSEEPGRLTLLSYPMIAVPAALTLLAVFFYLAHRMRRLAAIGIGEAFRS